MSDRGSLSAGELIVVLCLLVLLACLWGYFTLDLTAPFFLP